MKLELGCGGNPTEGYVHHDKRAHSAYVDHPHDLDVLPWPWLDETCEEILAHDVFEHLQLMPAVWLGECYRILQPGGRLRFTVPIWGSPYHIIDPTHVRGFHPLNFDYFIAGRDLHQRYGRFYVDFTFVDGTVTIASTHNLDVMLQK